MLEDKIFSQVIEMAFIKWLLTGIWSEVTTQTYFVICKCHRRTIAISFVNRDKA